jgi:hypothetical protein
MNNTSMRAKHLGILNIICTVKPAIAQLVEHLTVDFCSYQMVPGSIPGGRIDTPEAECHGAGLQLYPWAGGRAIWNAVLFLGK